MRSQLHLIVKKLFLHRYTPCVVVRLLQLMFCVFYLIPETKRNRKEKERFSFLCGGETMLINDHLVEELQKLIFHYPPRSNLSCISKLLLHCIFYYLVRWQIRCCFCRLYSHVRSHWSILNKVCVS